jgi:hypothetical protein
MMTPTIQRFVLATAVLLAPALALAQEVAERAGSEALHNGPSDSFQSARLGLMAFLAIVIGLVLFFMSQRDKRRQELIARFVDKGQEVPPALWPPAPSAQRELRRGTWLTSLGLGIGVVLYIATDDFKVAAWSLILLFLGAASFLNAVLFYPKPGSHRQG